MSDQTGSSHIICSICEMPIERRRDLVVMMMKRKMHSVHFMCRINEHLGAEKHWNTWDNGVVNSLTLKVLTPMAIVFVPPVTLILNHSLPVISGLSAWIGFWSAMGVRLLIAYFKFERKVPK